MIEIAELNNLKLFKGLADDRLKRISRYFVTRSFTRKEIIQFHGFHEDTIYFVRWGRVKISYFSEDGREFIVTVLEPGDVFSRHSEATATALEDTALWMISTPPAALRLIKELGEILRLFNDVIQDLAFREVSGRLARMILRKAETRGRVLDRSTVIELGLTHEEISNMVGSTRQTVTAILNRMTKRGIINHQRGLVTVIDREALEFLAE